MFDLASGGFSHLELTDQHGAEALERGAPIAGEIRIGDRNYARVPVLQRFLAEACGKADFIVRLGWNALHLSTPRGKPFDLIGYLQHLPCGVRPHEVILRATAGRGESALPLRLIVQRKPPEATEATRLALRRAAIKKGKKPANSVSTSREAAAPVSSGGPPNGGGQIEGLIEAVVLECYPGP